MKSEAFHDRRIRRMMVAATIAFVGFVGAELAGWLGHEGPTMLLNMVALVSVVVFGFWQTQGVDDGGRMNVLGRPDSDERHETIRLQSYTFGFHVMTAAAGAMGCFALLLSMTRDVLLPPLFVPLVVMYSGIVAVFVRYTALNRE